MKTIIDKEINEFFNSLIGYLSIGVFLIIVSLMMWVIPGTNVLDYGYVSMEPVFTLGPYAFMFLIPAITMRSIAEERRSGTMELLFTLPFRTIDILAGKFLGALVIVIFSLLPTILYYFSLYYLGNPIGNLDSSAIFGSYIGLVLLGAVFVSIGIFSSSVSDNQIVAFILAAALCFFLHEGLQFIALLDIWNLWLGNLEVLSINYHYQSMSNGLLEVVDITYFIGVIFMFLVFTWLILENRK